MPSQSIVFYDGGCGLCHRAVRFALAHDRDGSRFRFAALDGDAFRAAIPAPVRPTLPDSLVLLDPDGQVVSRYRVTGYPETFIIDRDGRIVTHEIGPREWSDGRYERALRTLIQRGVYEAP